MGTHHNGFYCLQRARTAALSVAPSMGRPTDASVWASAGRRGWGIPTASGAGEWQAVQVRRVLGLPA